MHGPSRHVFLYDQEGELDKIFETWRARQHSDLDALCASSDIVQAKALDGPPPSRYLLHIDAKTLVFDREGGVREVKGATIGLFIPPNYLRHAEAAQVLTLLSPENIFHPNISRGAVCIGPIAPGTPICTIVHRLYETLVFANFSANESDSLNPEACGWIRSNISRVPLERRALRRRALALDIQAVEN